MNHRRLIGAGAFLFAITFTLLVLRTDYGSSVIDHVNTNVIEPVKGKLTGPEAPPDGPHPVFKPAPPYAPPPIKDPFPLLASSKPPPIPAWNVPRKNLHLGYKLPVAPPLLVGFTRSWPMLLQTVVSYITAGWPAHQIYVVENTGTQQANARGQLSMQNPFYLNHTVLKGLLGVNVIQTPVLLNFAQLQNFYLSLSYEHNWPFYFWSHMDVLALSYEDGMDGLTPRYNEPGYKSLYELACQETQRVLESDERWGIRLFAYDHLALVNPVAYEDVGGWDTLIPYYMTDCDMHSRLLMRNWSLVDVRAGIITDTSVSLDDMRALYRDKTVIPAFTDPNPPPPPPPTAEEEAAKNKNKGWLGGLGSRSTSRARRDQIHQSARKRAEDAGSKPPPETPPAAEEHPPVDKELEYWRALLRTADSMFHYKHGDRGRNTWQAGQHGGQGEPFYYNAAGLAESIEVLTETGREVFRRKWGHRDCDLLTGAGLHIEDQWLVEKDWTD